MAYQRHGADQRYDHADKGQNSIDMKSAVISGAFEGLSKDEIDRFYSQNLNDFAKPPKKGSFQITSVTSGSTVARDDDPGEDSQDDLDDTHTYTEDNMSMDLSKTMDLDPEKSPILEQEEPPFEDALHKLPQKMPDLAPQVKERSSTDNQSRFRVVKIVTHEPFKRGRWTCFDYLPDPNKPNPDNVNLVFRENKDQFAVTGSETSSAASSIHYVHGQDDPSKNPLAPSQQTGAQTLTSPVYFDPEAKLHTTLNGHDVHGHDLAESSNVVPAPTSVITPESFSQVLPANGTAMPAYTPGAPPVHQASLPPSSQSLTSHTVSAAMTPQLPAMPSVLPPQPGDTTIPSSLGHNVLSSNYQSRPPPPTLPNNGQYPAPNSDIPQLAQDNGGVGITRAVSLDRSSRTHRISIGGEELELSDEFGRAGGLLEQIGASIPGALASPTKDNDGEDNSAPSSVAIDNKIEQAMDLVKSHLMFAVREEVEVLKEQIQELEELKRKLEFENIFLRAAASPETLAKLAQAQQSQPPSNT